MTFAVGLVVAIAGLVLAIIGLGLFIVFRIGLRVFDRSLSSEIAGQGREQIERAAMKIGNPLVRRFVLQRLVTAGGAIAVSVVRGAIQSRIRTGLWMAMAGVVVFVAAFYTASWLPLIWKPA